MERRQFGRAAAFGRKLGAPAQRRTSHGIGSAALGAHVKADAEKWWPIIKEFGIKVE
jgi:hypothetical protein